jgi:hypothetical protein
MLDGGDIKIKMRPPMRVFHREKLRRQPIVVQRVRQARRPTRMEGIPRILQLQGRMKVIEQRHEESSIEGRLRLSAEC